MKVGITGASGFLGSAVSREAMQRGWDVVAFSRNPLWALDRQGEMQVRSLGPDAGVNVEELDAVVHLAGEPIASLWTKKRLQRIRESRVDLASDLVAAIADLPPEKRPSVLVSASAVGYYGDRGNERLDEENDRGFGFIPDLCQAWENAALKATKLGVRVVILRIGLVLGQGGLLQRLRPIFRLGLGGRMGSGRQWMSWIHVSDLAGLVAECVANPSLHGVVNAVSPTPVTNREFTATYAKVLNRWDLLPVPGLALKCLPRGMVHLFLDSQRVEPVVSLAFEYPFRYRQLEPTLCEIEEDTLAARERIKVHSDIQTETDLP